MGVLANPAVSKDIDPGPFVVLFLRVFYSAAGGMDAGCNYSTIIYLVILIELYHLFFKSLIKIKF